MYIPGLQVILPKLTYVKCLAHGIHRVCETIRENEDQVDKLVSGVKKVFNKAPSRRNELRAAGVPMPKEVCITRWGTWLEAVTYLNDNFESLKTVEETFENPANKHIPIIKALLANPELKLRIEDILARYSDLPILLKNLQNLYFCRRSNGCSALIYS